MHNDFASHDRSLAKYFDTEIELSEFNRAQKERQAVFEFARAVCGADGERPVDCCLSHHQHGHRDRGRAYPISAESSFVRTISNVDLLVGARTSQINLLLLRI